MSRGAELFVVCPNPECRSEVSPYVTECPYCGTRVRKRAPKLDRRGPSRRPRGRRPAPSLSRLRPDEIPGIRPEARPYATGALVLVSCAVWIVGKGGLVSLSSLPVNGPLGQEWWRVLTTQFLYVSGVYMFGALLAVGIFGWLLERRYGPVGVLVLFALTGAGGAGLEVALQTYPVAFGGNGAALGLLCAWAVPDLMARIRGTDYEGDLLGVGVIAAALALIPLARDEASALAGLGGAVAGLLAGLVLARLSPR
ncbi:MAG TPA: rhomboid family intramembrane serine protease [Solirubrobacteraceae bacterium]|jgi:membrane associated rhomboid family serine protease|nr:rhomboid family intramembrane serine protease [Solirubrobacteraceae bacterium]